MFNEQRKRPEELAPMGEILTALLNDVVAFQAQMAGMSEYAKTLAIEFAELQKNLRDQEKEEDRQRLVELQTKFHEARVRYTEAEQALKHLQETWQDLTILGTPEIAQA